MSDVSAMDGAVNSLGSYVLSWASQLRAKNGAATMSVPGYALMRVEFRRDRRLLAAAGGGERESSRNSGLTMISRGPSSMSAFASGATLLGELRGVRQATSPCGTRLIALLTISSTVKRSGLRCETDQG